MPRGYGQGERPYQREDRYGRSGLSRRRLGQAEFRAAVLRRDRSTCKYCGRHISELQPWETMTAHHILPVSQGGSMDPSNGETTCSTCHRIYFLQPSTERRQGIRRPTGNNNESSSSSSANAPRAAVR